MIAYLQGCRVMSPQTVADLFHLRRLTCKSSCLYDLTHLTSILLIKSISRSVMIRTLRQSNLTPIRRSLTVTLSLTTAA